MSESTEVNPLLHFEFRIPFDQIKAEQIEPAITELLRDARERLDALIADLADRTFENTMRALDQLTERLEYAMGIVRHLEGVVTTPELRAAHNAVQPEVSAFYSSLPLNERLWRVIQAYASIDEAKDLKGTRRRYLRKT